MQAKRFWREATAEGAEVRLDGKPLRLSEGELWLTPALARAIAAEWNAVQGELRRDRLIMTQLAVAASRLAADAAPTVAALAAYAGADLLCYRASHPPELAALQAAAWDPWLDWAATRHPPRLITTTGITAIEQPPEALAALHKAIAAHDPPGLATLGVLVPALGSVVLALATTAGALTPAAAHAISVLDERYQEGLWGEDAEVAVRRVAIGQEVAAAAAFLEASRE